MALVLEIEHLSGVCFASQGPDSDAPDWPIQPDRAFSALVAAWAARGEDAGERAALTWLEALPPPHIEAAEVAQRTAPAVFVPPNDPRTRLAKSLETILGAHGRQPRRFPAVAALDRSGGLLTRMIWSRTEDAPPLAALDAVARDTAYVGHSTSLTRCRFLEGEAGARAEPARRRLYRGRLDRLELDFHARRRPSPGEPVREPPPETPPPTSTFGEDWLVLAIDPPLEGEAALNADLRGAPLLAKLIRDVLMSGYGEGGVPAWVSGHAADGAPSADPHLAVVPLANVGWAHSDGALMGFALVPPRGMKPLDDEGFRRALAKVASYDETAGRRTLVLTGATLAKATRRDGVALRLGLSMEADDRRSLDPARWMRPATTWATATPMVLERHLRASAPDERRAEVETLIARACVNIGLPEPAVVGREGSPDRFAVLADKHSAANGAPSATPSGGNPRWMRWRIPERFASRPLVHAVIRFPVAVQGPVVLGAGRFVGLGLCLPLDAEKTTS